MSRTTNPRKKRKVEIQNLSSSTPSIVEVSKLYLSHLLKNDNRGMLITSIENGGRIKYKIPLAIELSSSLGFLQLKYDSRKLYNYFHGNTTFKVSKMLLKKDTKFSLKDMDDHNWDFIHINTKKESNCQYLFEKAIKENYTVILVMQLKFINKNNSPQKVTLHLSDFNGSLLHRAVARKDIAVIKTLLRCNSDINMKNNEGMTPLHVAVDMGDADIVKLFLENGVHNKVEFFRGLTPFHLALRQPNLDMVKVFIENTDINTDYGDNETLLHIAALENAYEAVELILKKKSSINKKNFTSAFYMTAMYGDASIVELLLKNGANVNAQNSSGENGIQLALCTNRIANIKLLIKNGADVNLPSSSGEIALHSASYRRITPIEIIELILNFTNDINTTANDGMTAIHYAAWSHNVDAVKFLLGKNADPNIKNCRGSTPLHLAIFSGYKCFPCFEFIKILVDYGADVNAVDNDLTTPLHLACFTKSTEVVRYLLANGADSSMRDKQGKTTLHYACENNLHRMSMLIDNIEKHIEDMLNILVEKENISVNCVDKTGKTPIYYSTGYDSFIIEELLLNIGADINIVNINNGSGFEILIRQMDIPTYLLTDDPPVLLKHVVKMKVLKLWVRRKILDEIYETDNKNQLEWIQDYESVCSEELDLMKTINIGQSGLTYYDFLKKTQHDVVNFSQNQNIVNAIKGDGLLDRFPIYGHFLKCHLREGQRRYNLYEKVLEPLIRYSSLKKLPRLCINEIFRYLNCCDFKMLYEAIKEVDPLHG